MVFELLTARGKSLWNGTISCARCLNRCYRNGGCGMHYHILLSQYSQNYYTYNSEVTNFNREYRMVAALQMRKLDMF